ncbi:PAS domain-containing protein [Porifericola rhodea]|uniref:PAS domain-containing sensor histidine kinase n=1 Tax=Porifericola rhodea TaxID=930972 RepID=UPI002666DDCC|nr:PAS domain-containing protein [Porifericola rhodea]WKN30885.1 PAS domain-containing protein [Porifericola rhodea]
MTKNTSIQSSKYKALETVPDLYLILNPEFYIITASNAYLEATLTARADIIGKHIFEVFPDNPDTPQANSVKNLHSSLQEVKSKLKPHNMALQRYDVPRPKAKGGGFEEKYWLPVNTPVLNENGQLDYIIHKVSDVTEKIKSEQYIEELTLREAEASQEAETERENLKAVFNQAPVGIGIYRGKDFIVELFNPGIASIVGKKPKDLIGKPVFEILPELKEQGYEDILNKVYYSGKPFEAHEIEAEIRRYGRKEKCYFNTRYHPLRNTDQQVVGIIQVVTEVTSQVEARQNAQISERKLRLVTDAMPVLIAYVDREQKYRFANQAYESWFHQNPDELLGKSILEVVGQEAYDGVKGYIQRALSGENLQFESRMPYRKDFVKYIRSAYVPDIQNGKVQGFYTLVTDISDQVEALHKIEESERYFRMMADNVPVMIWVTRPDGYCTYLNKQWYDYTGQNEESGLGFGWLTAVHPEDAQLSEDIFMDANTRKTHFELTYRLRGVDGRYRWAIDTAMPNFDHQGKFQGFVGAVFDIHERKIAEEALQLLSKELASAIDGLKEANFKIKKSNKELAASNQQLNYINADLDNFIYTASHDLRAPISNIEGLISAIHRKLPEDSKEDPMINKLLSMISKSIQRFKTTVNDLTQITKVQREGKGEDVTKVDIAEVVREVKQDLTYMIEEAGAEFEMQIEDHGLIYFSAKNARSIVYNLISNAIKYRSPKRKPVIKINCYPEGKYLVLSVEDNGLGMDISNEKKIFAMFKRLHDHVEGTGVGLYIVKKIVDNAGGKIEVHSQLDQGTSFKVFFHQSEQIQSKA